ANDAADIGLEGGDRTAVPGAPGAGEQAAVELRERQVCEREHLLRALADGPARDGAARVLLREGVQPREMPGLLRRAVLAVAVAPAHRGLGIAGIGRHPEAHQRGLVEADEGELLAARRLGADR